MTFARILYPDSKLGTFQHLNHYYEQPSFSYSHIMRTMVLMAEHYDEYLTHLFHKSQNIIKRDTSVCYYDCSNYCRFESPDQDYADEVTGEIVKGFRKYGLSKQHQ